MNNNQLIEIKNLNKNYGENQVLKNLDFVLFPEEIISIMGYSGVGKTTFINILLGLDTLYTADVFETSEKIACVFQEDRLLPWLSVYDNIHLVNKSLERDKIIEILKVLNLDNNANFLPNELSGGMKQRVAIARALAFDSKVVIMDEPLKSTDKALGDEVLSYIKNTVQSKGGSLILITHDIEKAVTVSDRILLLDGNFTDKTAEYKGI